MSELGWNIHVKTAVLELFEVEMSKCDEVFVAGVHNYGSKKGYISANQATVLGRIYCRYLQNGIYQHHNWWPDKL